VRNPLLAQPRLERRAVVPGVTLIQVHRQQLEVDGRTGLQATEQDAQCVTIFPSRHGHEDPISSFEQAVIADGAAHVPKQTAFDAFDVHGSDGRHATLIANPGPRDVAASYEASRSPGTAGAPGLGRSPRRLALGARGGAGAAADAG